MNQQSLRHAQPTHWRTQCCVCQETSTTVRNDGLCPFCHGDRVLDRAVENGYKVTKLAWLVGEGKNEHVECTDDPPLDWALDIQINHDEKEIVAVFMA